MTTICHRRGCGQHHAHTVYRADAEGGSAWWCSWKCYCADEAEGTLPERGVIRAPKKCDTRPGNPLDLQAVSDPLFTWMMNITDETRPIPVGSFQVPGLVGRRNPLMTGCHQPVETIRGTEVAAAWFASGLRIIDISNPHSLRQVAFHVPDPPPGADRPCSNDLFIDDRGLIYLIDRNRGLSILERT